MDNSPDKESPDAIKQLRALADDKVAATCAYASDLRRAADEIERLRGVLQALARDAEFAQRHAYSGELNAAMKFASNTRAKIKEVIESGEPKQ